MVVRADHVAVSVHFAASDDRSSVEAAIEAESGDVINSREQTVEAWIPPDGIPGVVALPTVQRMDVLRQARPAVATEGRSYHGAETWQQDDVAGENIKIGIIDVGFGGLSPLLGIEIPAVAGQRCYTAPGVWSTNLGDCQWGSPHGTAVTETIVDMAPRATFYIANPLSPLDLQETVDWMASQGVTVINHSVVWTWDGPGDGTSIYTDSPLHGVDLAASHGITWVNAAGNFALSTWRGPVTGQSGLGLLLFAPGIAYNAVELEKDQTFVAQLRWDDSWGNASRNLQLYLEDKNHQLVASSTDAQGVPGTVPLEGLVYTAPVSGTYYLAVGLFGASPSWVQLQAFTGQALQIHQAASTIANPAESASPAMITVGAVNLKDLYDQVAEPYSSQGPTLDQRIKPDLTGLDGMQTATYGAFYGTSQSSAHIAGLAALVRQAHPDYAPSDVRLFLTRRARHTQFRWPTNVVGAGSADLQMPCVWFSSALGLSFPGSDAASGRVAVSGDVGCNFTATTLDPWIHVRTEGWNVYVDVDANPGPPRTGFISAATRVITIAQGAPLPTLTIDRTRVDVTAIIDAKGYVIAQTPPQQIMVVQHGAGPVNWTARASVPWLSVTPGGSGTSPLVVSIADRTGALTAPTYANFPQIWITPTGTGQATNSLVVNVQLSAGRASAFHAPFGVVDTPTNNVTGASGAIAVSGWALDDAGVARVQVWRDPVAFDPRGAIASNGKVYIGEATFVEGARPDVASRYPAAPLRTRAGWGLLILTNMLPDVTKRTPAGGNGTFKLTVTASDIDGHATMLGTRTITLDNAHAVKPFGTLDTPAPGAARSSLVANFGWALARPGRAIPTDGSTMWVFVDGVPLGHPVYRPMPGTDRGWPLYRTTSRRFSRG